MRHLLLPFVFFFLLSPHIQAQLSCDPLFPITDETVTIYYDATQGNGALAGVSPVWAHLGVITNLSTTPTDWKHVATTWGTNNAAAMMTNAGPNLWKKTFNIRSFFNIPANETVLQLAFVFRNSSGSVVGRAADGSDMYYSVYPDNTQLRTTYFEPTATALLKNLGEQIPVKAAASKISTLRLLDNGVEIAQASDTNRLSHTIQITAQGLHDVSFIASTGVERDTSTFFYIVPVNMPAQDPPAGSEWGITELAPDSVRLVLYAPGKQVVYAVGDFNQWIPTPQFQMHRSIDGSTWWIDVPDITPGQPVRFQYLVDGVLRIADPLSTLVLDPWNDSYISPLSYPNLPAYPAGKTTGIVSVFQTQQPAFIWQATGYVRPKKSELAIYELLMRDFIARHDYNTLLDTLDYLDRLGVTAVELMPVNEFDGNINWGYGPSFHKALDKYYGSAETLKKVVDACHQRGMAVILDVVFNHVTGSSPLAQLYWDSGNNRPAANNPWLNPVAKHDYNVFNDFNHESQATKTYVKNCLKYWISEFKIDGYRFDLSKGFTQKNTLGNPNSLALYDATRVAILKDYANTIWSVDPGIYVILEHFADNSEEKELAEYGMMLWGNMWQAYKDLSLGYSSSTSLSWINYKQRNWSVPHLVGYMESHDEERIGYELKTFGNSLPGYNIKSLEIGMQRLEMLNNLLFTIPGPKMLWQFGELGYDFPINYCEDGTVNNNCRTSPKPIRWDYLDNPYRQHVYATTAALLQLRKHYDAFHNGNFQANIAGGQVRSVFLNGSDLKAAVFVNVGTTSSIVTNPGFQQIGFWFEYYTGDTLFVGSGVPTTFTLAPGEYRLYLDKKVSLPGGSVAVRPDPEGFVEYFQAFPNPTSGDCSLEFSLRESGDTVLEIFDLTGKKVFGRRLEDVEAGLQQMDLPSGNWAPGVYIAALKDGSGHVAARKLLKG